MILSIYTDHDFPGDALRSLVTHDAIGMLQILSHRRSIEYRFDNDDWAPVIEDFLVEVLWGDLDDDLDNGFLIDNS